CDQAAYNRTLQEEGASSAAFTRKCYRIKIGSTKWNSLKTKPTTAQARAGLFPRSLSAQNKEQERELLALREAEQKQKEDTAAA
ncbi:unnamed protein product, partial [Ectocarpus sp. 13 AM-2016]